MRVGKALARAGKWHSAKRLADAGGSWSFAGCEILITLAAAQARAGDPHAAGQTAYHIDLDRGFEPEEARAFASIAAVQAEMGDLFSAERSIRRSLSLVGRRQADEPELAEDLAAASVVLANAGLRTSSAQVFTAAGVAARQLHGFPKRTRALIGLADTLRRMGNASGGVAHLREARDTLLEQAADEERAASLAAVACAYARAGLAEEAAATCRHIYLAEESLLPDVARAVAESCSPPLCEDLFLRCASFPAAAAEACGILAAAHPEHAGRVSRLLLERLKQ